MQSICFYIFFLPSISPSCRKLVCPRLEMISDRAKAVKRIVEYWGRLNVGISSRCAYARACAAAEEICAQLNRDLL